MTKKTNTKISFIGLGYVGLTTSVCFADKGFHVIGVDVDKSKLTKISKGKPDMFEPNLNELLCKMLKTKRFSTSDNLSDSIKNSDVTFITVGTPANKDGSVGLQFIKSAATDIGYALKNKSSYHLIVVKSTIVPGTTENIIVPIIAKISGKKYNKDFGICYNPEFLSEGSAINDMTNPDKVVLGSSNSQSKKIINNLYNLIYSNQKINIVNTTIPTAELIKYANNAFLATKISYINTIANICNNIPNVNVDEVAKAIGLDNRINSKFLSAGPGYGGSCFPKDVKALIQFSSSLDYSPNLLIAVDEVNQLQPILIINLIKQKLSSTDNKTISILGLAFKSKTNDMRESVAIKIVNELLKQHFTVKVHDPEAIDNAKQIFGDQVDYHHNIIEAIKNSDCCVILNDSIEYKSLKPSIFKKYMNNSLVVDTKRIFNYSEFNEIVDYYCYGVGSY